jgi:hypothetical protein
MSMSRLLLALALVGCGASDDPKGKDSQSSTTGSQNEGPFHVLANRVPGGMMLSGHSTSDGLVVVGGDLHGGTGTISRYDGSTLCVEQNAVDRALWWIHGSSPDDWYAVGVGGIVVHESGGTQTRMDAPTDSTLFGVYDDGTDVWAVGGDVANTLQGEIWRWDGATWTLVADELPGLLFKTWNSWFVGHGIAYQWDGNALVEHHPPNGARLVTARGSSADDLWAVGGLTNAELYHYSGGSWETVDVDIACDTDGFNGVWVDDQGVWTAGHSGSMALRDPAGGWSCADRGFIEEDFHAVLDYEGNKLWLGGNLLAGSDEENYGTIGFHGSDVPTLEVSESCAR